MVDPKIVLESVVSGGYRFQASILLPDLDNRNRYLHR